MCAKTLVVVAMSGGVDSSLTAALLLRKGYDVIGVTMRLWDNDAEDEVNRGCCSLESVNDAKRVAYTIGIPHYTLNFKDVFKKKVVDYFIAEYGRGRTPNPCIACNRYMKFDYLLRRTAELGGKFLATGHYAQIEYDQERKRYILRKGVDASKDQSYVLYHLNQQSLQHFMFPLGKINKTETRQMARDLGLSVAEKKDSQEICFIPDNDYKGFLCEMNPQAFLPGDFVDTKGRIIGRHHGLPNYTVGQRKGLGIMASEPLYVVALKPERNQVVLGTSREVFSSELIAEDTNYILLDELTQPMTVKAKIRYGAKEDEALISPLPEGKVHVEFVKPQRAVTPGQSVVFYQDDIVVGGGVIREVVK